MTNKLSLFLFSISILFIFQCTPEEQSKEFSTKIGNSILVSCEGQFMNSNAGLTYIDLEEDTLALNIYKDLNTQPLGDVVQGIYQADDEILIISNTPGAVHFLDINTLKLNNSISIEGTPKNLINIDGKHFLLGDVYTGMHLLDIETKTLVKTIATNGANTEMILANGKIFACNYGAWDNPGKQVMIYDAETIELIDSIETNIQPVSITQLGEEAYVVCQGDSGTPSSIDKININSLEKTGSVSLEGKVPVSYSYKIRNLNNELYVLSDGVYSYNIASEEFEKINSSAASPYGLDTYNAQSELFLADAKDYASQGSFFILDSDGEIKKEFTVGIVPNGAILIE